MMPWWYAKLPLYEMGYCASFSLSMPLHYLPLGQTKGNVNTINRIRIGIISYLYQYHQILKNSAFCNVFKSLYKLNVVLSIIKLSIMV